MKVLLFFKKPTVAAIQLALFGLVAHAAYAEEVSDLGTLSVTFEKKQFVRLSQKLCCNRAFVVQ